MFGFIIAILTAIVGYGLYYATLPQLSLDSPGFLVLVLVLGVVFCIVAAKEASDKGRSVGLPVTAAIVLILILPVGGIFSSAALRASAYSDLLGDMQKLPFSTSFPPIDLKQPPLVSIDMAERAAEKKLSEVPALGSQVKIGDLQKQLVKGKLYWVAFLEYQGFFSWNSRGVTPGYVRVSATDSSDVELVLKNGGKDLRMKYLQSAFFGDNAERYVRMHGFATAGLQDFSPEIDDDGKPYLVISVFDRKVGFAGADVTGVILLDVQNGAIKYYAIDDVPAWVDRVQPEEIVAAQLSDRLEYVHGWINPSKKDQLEISGDLDLIYGQDGRAYFYAGLGSTNHEGGLVGFVLIDSRTKKVTQYDLQGVTAKVAQGAAEGVMPEKKYSATTPLPFMVEGVPSYVMALRDATGIARLYAIVDVGDYQKVAVGDTLENAARAYQFKQSADRTHLGASVQPDLKSLRGRIERIGAVVHAGNTAYELLLTGQGNRLFIADANLSDQLVVTQKGDEIELQVLQGTDAVTPIQRFKNLSVEALATDATKH